jgi:hypothetical protein
MKRQHLLLLALATLFLPAACASPVPLAKNHPISTQYKIRASHHWDIIAEDVVQQTILALEARRDLAGLSLFVEQPEEKTGFNAVFQKFLNARLFTSGLPVAVNPQGALRVRYETQVVCHNSPRPYGPGMLTLTGGLAGGGTVLALRGTSSPWVAGGAVLGTAAALDLVAGQTASPTHTELIVTTFITDAYSNAYVLYKTDAYYFEEKDWKLFTPPMPGKTLEVVDK